MISLISFLWLWLSFCLPLKDKSLWKLPDGSDWRREKLGLVLVGRAMLSKSLIQFSVDRQGCFISLLFGLRPNYGGGDEDHGDLLQKVPCRHCQTQCLWPCNRRLLDMHRQIWVSLLWGHCSFLLGPGAHNILFVPYKSLFPQDCVSPV